MKAYKFTAQQDKTLSEIEETDFNNPLVVLDDYAITILEELYLDKKVLAFICSNQTTLEIYLMGMRHGLRFETLF